MGEEQVQRIWPGDVLEFEVEFTSTSRVREIYAMFAAELEDGSTSKIGLSGLVTSYASNEHTRLNKATLTTGEMATKPTLGLLHRLVMMHVLLHSYRAAKVQRECLPNAAIMLEKEPADEHIEIKKSSFYVE